MSSLVVSSRLSCISGRSSSSSSNKGVNRVLFNKPFPVSIKECKGYTDVLSVSQDYDIYLDSSGLHWYLLVHAATGNQLPYVSLEIVSDSILWGKMIPTMRIIEADQVDNSSRDSVIGHNDALIAKIIDKIYTKIHDTSDTLTATVETGQDTQCDPITDMADDDYDHIVPGAFGINIGDIVGAAIGSAVGGALVGQIGTVVGCDVGAGIGGCGIGGAAIDGLITYGGICFKNSLAAIFDKIANLAIIRRLYAVLDARGLLLVRAFVASYYSCFGGMITFTIATKLLRSDGRSLPGALVGAAVGGGAISACIDSGIIDINSDRRMITSTIGGAVLGGGIAGAVATYTSGSVRSICSAIIGGALGASSVGRILVHRAVDPSLDSDIKLKYFRMENLMLLFRGLRATRVATQHMTLMELCETAETVRLGMVEYNVATNNCQHFCNNVLKELGLPPHPTTLGSETTTLQDIDDINEVFIFSDPDDR